jgi:hypothetical protein
MRAEQVCQRLLHPALGIDVAVQHAAAQLLRRGVDELDLVRFAHDPIRYSLAHPRSGHLLDLVGDALQMLDVHGGDHVDARGESPARLATASRAAHETPRTR